MPGPRRAGRNRLPELAQVVSCTDESPLAPNLLQAAQQELPKPATLLDLPEHRLHDLLASGVDGPPPLRAELPAHTIRN